MIGRQRELKINTQTDGSIHIIYLERAGSSLMFAFNLTLLGHLIGRHVTMP